MISIKAVDSNTLNWVKQEIDECLKQARHALEAFAANPAEIAQMRHCANQLQQVRGTLQMIELHGPAQLAGEMEELALTLLNDTARQQDATYELLMRAILQLPDYLERLQMGHPEHPLALLPLLNDLRAARGQRPLAGGALFAPNLNVFKPGSTPTKPAQNIAGFGGDIRTVARKLRPSFQLALVNFHRDTQAVEHVEQLIKVIQQLEQFSHAESLVQLWWVTGGVLESLTQGGLLSNISIPLLGQVDRQIKRLIDLGEEEWAAAPPRSLIRDLLFHVTQAQSVGARVMEIKQAFNLNQFLPDANAAGVDDAPGAPNRELIHTVAIAIKEDLAKVKDGLDIFVRSEQRSVSDLEPLATILRQTGGTLGMLSLDTGRDLMLRQVAVLQRMIEENGVLNEASLVELASALLRVESSLDALEAKQAETAGAADAEQVEYRQVLNAVVKEAKVDISRVKDAIISFVTQPTQYNLLDNAPHLIKQVMGSLAMLAEFRAAELLGICKKYIAEELLEQRVVPDPERIETLADVIVSIEYYLEALDEDRTDRATILDLAQERVAQAGLAPFVSPAPDEIPVQESVREDVAVLDEIQATPEPADEIAAAQALVVEPLPKVPAMQPESPMAVNIVATAPAPTATPALNIPVAGFARPEGIDDEIIEIFIEEAQEELASISKNLAAWKLQPDNPGPLALVRRSFHTLKGSGRMVGALVIGEFAWAVESMLNRVINGTVQIGPDVFGIVEQAQNALPQLIEHFNGGRAADVDVQDLVNRANQISQPEQDQTPQAVPALPAAEQIQVTVAAEPGVATVDVLETGPEFHETNPAEALEIIESLAAAGPEVIGEAELPYVAEMLERAETPVPAKMAERTEIPVDAENIAATAQSISQLYDRSAGTYLDPVLLEIFSKEAGTHLAAMQEFVDCCQLEPEDCRITDSLIRTLHTLHGSAGMAGINDIATISGMLEEYAKQLNQHHLVLSPEIVAMMRTSIDVITGMVAALQNPEVERPDMSAVLQTLADFFQSPLPVKPVAANVPEIADRDTEAAAKSAALPEKDNEIVEIFLEEAREILDASETVLQQWMADQANHKYLEELQRQLHTLKGGARMANISAIGDLSHNFESVITVLLIRQVAPSAHLPHLMQKTQDRLVQMLDSASINLPVTPATELIASLQSVSGTESFAEEAQPDIWPVPEVQVASKTKKFKLEVLKSTKPREQQEQHPQASREAQLEDKHELEDQQVPEDQRDAARPQQEQIRVRADLLDNLVNFAAEISISRSRIEQQMGAFKFNLVEVNQIISRLRGQLRNLEIETEAQILFRYAETANRENEEFDPLEFDRFSQMQQLSRSLLESVSDLANIEGLLNGLTRESETLLVQQSRVNTDLHEGLMRARMVQFAVLMPRLRRIVRQTCQQLEKQVDLRVIGAENEMDRTVLDRLVPCLEHMLRNAIDHGIESPEVRRTAGKQGSGVITLRLQREGSAMAIQVSDNGGGLNLAAIRSKAVKRGLLGVDADATDNEVMQFILEPGFTTSTEVTQISGRGVGLDVVNSEIKQLNGTLEIASEPGKGTTFTVRLPLTLSINRALLVHVGEELYAIPLNNIERVVQLTYEELTQLYGAETPSYSAGGYEYHLAHMDTVLSGTRHIVSGPKRKHPVLLARAGDHRVALEVDGLLGSREIVIKSVGPQISTIRGITGATILGDGRVVLILDINALVRAGTAGAKVVKDIRQTGAPITAVEPGFITAMVVDDSITVRKVTTRLLERHNIHVLSAKDGIDALALLQDHIPDIMLLDIEMPRMDGYELATHMRNEERLKNIPIIMITSRTGQKHRDRARLIGVNSYMGKPFQESELLENIGNLLGERLEVQH
ncbi:MAG: Hpt domain-containing protein [Gammaproteobacteria bacterium]